ncbi:conserved domain protein [Prevotella denticola CRIS 18C-A]|uniref:Conserved domain protein n=1 Tax=Prevotella denticola CRIS 18C-A TaxID=944557 RepID=F0H908_9BACT|nr:conserved domain protein [Prevotella denticola CRIS 18C-A]
MGTGFPAVGNRLPDAPVLTVSVVCYGARTRISQGQAIVRMLGTGYGMYFQTGKNHQKRMISLHLTHPHLLG